MNSSRKINNQLKCILKHYLQCKLMRIYFAEKFRLFWDSRYITYTDKYRYPDWYANYLPLLFYPFHKELQLNSRDSSTESKALFEDGVLDVANYKKSQLYQTKCWWILHLVNLEMMNVTTWIHTDNKKRNKR